MSGTVGLLVPSGGSHADTVNPINTPSLVGDDTATVLDSSAIETPKTPQQVDVTRLNGSGTPKTARPRRYTFSEWQRIRPLFTKYYIQQNMQLRDVMKRLAEERNFHATEPMYKKRINSWGLAKTMRAAEKDVFIANTVGDATSIAASNGSFASHVDKIVRHARAQARKTTGNQDLVDRAKRLRRIAALIEGLSVPNLVPRGEMAVTEKLFLAHQRLISLHEPTSWIEAWGADTKIVSTLSMAIKEWTVHAFSQSRKHFEHASAKLYQRLQHSVGTCPSPLIFTWMDPTKWAGCMPVYSRFIRFILASTTHTLGSTHPYTIAAQGIVDLPWNAYRGLAISDYYSSNIDLTATTHDIWYIVNLFNIKFTLRNGLPDLAIRMINKAATLLQMYGALHIDRRIALDVALAEGYYQQGHHQASLDILEKVIQGDKVHVTITADLHSVAADLHSAESLAARITENHIIDLDRTQDFHLKSYRVQVAAKGPGHIDTVWALASLLKFCQRRDISLEAILPKEEWGESYKELDSMTDGLWDMAPHSATSDKDSRRPPYADDLFC